MSTVLLLYCLCDLGRFNGPAAAEAAPLQQWPAADRSIFVSIFTTQWMSHGQLRRIHTKMITTLLLFTWSQERERWGELHASFLRGCSLNYKTWAEKQSSAPVRTSLFRSPKKPNAAGYFGCADEFCWFFLVAVSLVFPTWTDKRVYTAIRREFSHGGRSSPVVPSHCCCCCWRCWLSEHQVDWLTTWAEQ